MNQIKGLAWKTHFAVLNRVELCVLQMCKFITFLKILHGNGHTGIIATKWNVIVHTLFEVIVQLKRHLHRNFNLKEAMHIMIMRLWYQFHTKSLGVNFFLTWSAKVTATLVTQYGIDSCDLTEPILPILEFSLWLYAVTCSLCQGCIYLRS